jgi:hypothetical protein
MLGTTVAILTVAGFVQGFFGFGFSAFALVLLTIELSTQHAVGILVSVAPLSTFTSAILQRRAMDVRRILPLALTTLLFFPLGAWILYVAPEPALHLALAVIVVGAASMQLFSGQIGAIPRGRVSGGTAAALSGLFGGAIGVPGLTMTAYLYGSEEDPAIARASLQFFFLFTTTVAAATHAVAGTITRETLLNAVVAAAPVIIAIATGLALARRTDTGKLRVVYASGLGLLGVYTAVRAVMM